MQFILLKPQNIWLKLVDANKVPTMGSLYHDMDLAKETKSEKLRKRL